MSDESDLYSYYGMEDPNKPEPQQAELPPLDIDHSFFERFINTLSTPLYGVSNLLKGDFAEAGTVLAKGLSGGELFGFAQMNREEMDTTKDVLDHYGVASGAGREVLSFIGDIALDPLTYLTGGVASGARTAMSKIGGQVAKKALTETGEKALGTMARKIGKEIAETGAEKVGKQEALNLGAKEAQDKFFERLGKETGRKAEKDAIEKAGVNTAEDFYKKIGVEQAKTLGYLDPGGITARIPFTKKQRNLVSHDDMVGFFSKTGLSPGASEVLATQVSNNVAFPIVGGVFAAGKGLLGNSPAFKNLVSKIDSSQYMSEADKAMGKGSNLEYGKTQLLNKNKDVFYQALPEEFRNARFAEQFEKLGAKGMKELLADKDIIPEHLIKEFDNEMFNTVKGFAPEGLSDAYQNSQDFFHRNNVINNTDFGSAVEFLESTTINTARTTIGGNDVGAMDLIKEAIRKGDQKALEEVGKLKGVDKLAKGQIDLMVDTMKSINRRNNHVLHNVENFDDWKVAMLQLDFDDTAIRKILTATKQIRDEKLTGKFKKKAKESVLAEHSLDKLERDGVETILKLNGEELNKVLKMDISRSKSLQSRTFDTFAEGEEVGLFYNKDIGKILEKQIDNLAIDRKHRYVLNYLNSAEVEASALKGMKGLADEAVKVATKAPKEDIIYHATMNKFKGLPKASGKGMLGQKRFLEGEPYGVFYASSKGEAIRGAGLSGMKSARSIEGVIDSSKAKILDASTDLGKENLDAIKNKVIKENFGSRENFEEFQRYFYEEVSDSISPEVRGWLSKVEDARRSGGGEVEIYDAIMPRLMARQIRKSGFNAVKYDDYHVFLDDNLVKPMTKGVDDVVEAVAKAPGTQNVREALLGKLDPDKIDMSVPLRNFVKEMVEIDVPGEAFKKFEDYTKVMKGFMTVLNPSFHMRNMTSGAFMAGMNPRVGMPEFLRSVKQLPKLMLASFGGDKVGKKLLTKQMNAMGAYDMMGKVGGKANLPSDALKALQDTVTDRVTGAKFTMEEMLDKANAHGLLDTGFELEVGKIGKGKIGAIADYANAVANRGENYMRFAHFVENVRSGLPFDQAVDQTKKWFVDYTPSSPFERKIRTVIPFYKFTKQVIKEYMPEIARRPATMAPFKSMYHMNENEENIPEWMKKTFTVPIGKDKDGNPLYITGFGLPIEAVASVGSLSGAMSMLNPMIKFPIEAGTGTNLFFGSDYASYDAPYQSILRLPEPIRDKLLNKHTNKNGETYYTMNPETREIIDRLPGYRQFATINKLADTRTGFWSNFANAMTGVNIKSLDDRQRQRVANEIIEKALDKAKKQGTVGQFTSYYQKDKGVEKHIALKYQDQVNAQRRFKAKIEKARNKPRYTEGGQ